MLQNINSKTTHTCFNSVLMRKKKKKVKLFADLLGNVHVACPSLGLKSWLFFMAAQHKVAHWKVGSPTTTRQERGKGLKAGGWGILGERDPNTREVTVVKKRQKAVTRWNKMNCPQRETGAPLKKRLSSKLGDPFLVTRSGQVDSRHPCWMRQAGFYLPRWDVGGGGAQRGHYVAEDGEGRCRCPAEPAGTRTAGRWATHMPSVLQRLFIYRHYRSPRFFPL